MKRRYTEAQISEALDGKFIAFHFSGRMLLIDVPTDFNPFSPEGERVVRRAIEQKVLPA